MFRAASVFLPRRPADRHERFLRTGWSRNPAPQNAFRIRSPRPQEPASCRHSESQAIAKQIMQFQLSHEEQIKAVPESFSSSWFPTSLWGLRQKWRGPFSFVVHAMRLAWGQEGERIIASASAMSKRARNKADLSRSRELTHPGPSVQMWPCNSPAGSRSQDTQSHKRQTAHFRSRSSRGSSLGEGEVMGGSENIP